MNHEPVVDFEDSEGDPVELEVVLLEKIKIQGVPNNSWFRVVSKSDDLKTEEIEGQFCIDNGSVSVFMFLDWYRKYWSGPLGMAQHMDLLKRHIEFRQKVYRDVSFISFVDEGDWCHLNYEIHLGSVNNYNNLLDAYSKAKLIVDDLDKKLEMDQQQVSFTIEKIKQEIDLYAELKIEELFGKVQNDSVDPKIKGILLETLLKKLFEKIPGFTVTNRVRTKTEEIDLEIVNHANTGFWAKESALILVEAKNQKAKTNKNDLIQFKEKIENRRARCKLGFIISSSGFAKTVNYELMRSSSSDIVIVPITLQEIAGSSDSFEVLLQQKWQEAIRN